MKTLQEIVKVYSEEHLKYDRMFYMKPLFDFFEDKEITYSNFKQWLFAGLNNKILKRNGKPFAAETIYTQMCLIKSAFKYCEDSGFIDKSENIFNGEVLSPQMKNAFKKKRDKEYKPVEVKHDLFENFIFEYLPEYSKESNLFEICALAYYTGMRLNEICKVEWKDVKTNFIWVKNTKERLDRKAALDKNALTLMQSINRYRNDVYVFPSYTNRDTHILSGVVGKLIKRHWAKYIREKGVKTPFTFKSLRTAYIQSSHINGVPIEAIRKQVGHRSIYITDYSYNGSLCERAINEISLNPKYEIIREVSKVLLNKLDENDVMRIDVDLFCEKVAQAAFESRKTIHIQELAETNRIRNIG